MPSRWFFFYLFLKAPGEKGAVSPCRRYSARLNAPRVAPVFLSVRERTGLFSFFLLRESQTLAAPPPPTPAAAAAARRRSAAVRELGRRGRATGGSDVSRGRTDAPLRAHGTGGGGVAEVTVWLLLRSGDGLMCEPQTE